MDPYLKVVLVGYFLTFVYRQVKKNKRKNLEIIDYTDLIQSDEAFDLYLRSFEDDGESRELPIGFHTLFLRSVGTFEEEIAFNFRKRNLIAIGRPNEELPELGAQRLYVTDDLWKERVSCLAEKCTTVIVKPSFTDGLFWELEMIERKGLWGKLIFYHVFKNTDNSTAREFYYNTFRKILENKFNIIMQDYSSKAKFSYFLDDKTHIQVQSLIDVPYFNENELQYEE